MRTISQARLRECLRWDEARGRFVRRIAGGGLKAGAITGSPAGEGYRQVQVDGKNYREHRLVWLYFKGEFPACDLDHINGDRSDNRLDNLREASSAVNAQNKRKATAANKCGLLGVSAHPRGKGWCAFIMCNYKNKNLGVFESPELASAAYLAAKRKLHEGCTI